MIFPYRVSLVIPLVDPGQRLGVPPGAVLHPHCNAVPLPPLNPLLLYETITHKSLVLGESEIRKSLRDSFSGSVV